MDTYIEGEKLRLKKYQRKSERDCVAIECIEK
jgi:hypothetical protein